MDEKWAKTVLDTWIDTATRIGGSNGLSPDNETVRWLLQREDQTRRVIKRILGGDKLPPIVEKVSNFYSFSNGIRTAHYALGRLQTDQETQAKLGTSAPKMAADAMHPTIWDAAAKLWEGEHFGQSVQRAATFLNAHIQDLVGRHDVSDSQLMSQVFSDKSPEHGKSRLRWPGDDANLTVKAMRSGMLSYAQGCFQAIRNPSTHTTAEMPRQECLEQLAALSVLARWVDGCELLEA